MYIYLRQSGVKFGTPKDEELALNDAAFIRIVYAEVFSYAVECLCAVTQRHFYIEKTKDDNWKDPINGRVYEFLYVHGEDNLENIPEQLIIELPPESEDCEE